MYVNMGEYVMLIALCRCVEVVKVTHVWSIYCMFISLNIYLRIPLACVLFEHKRHSNMMWGIRNQNCLDGIELD